MQFLRLLSWLAADLCSLQPVPADPETLAWNRKIKVSGMTRHSAEEIVNKLGLAEVELGRGKTISEVRRQLGVS